jgi:hypothetical protein
VPSLRCRFILYTNDSHRDRHPRAVFEPDQETAVLNEATNRVASLCRVMVGWGSVRLIGDPSRRKAIQERSLSLHNAHPRLVQRKPGDPIELRDCLDPARATRPLQLKGAGDDRRRVEIGLYRPGGHELATRLPHFPKGTSGPSGAGIPSSSVNSRRAAASGASSASYSPWESTRRPHPAWPRTGHRGVRGALRAGLAAGTLGGPHCAWRSCKQAIRIGRSR